MTALKVQEGRSECGPCLCPRGGHLLASTAASLTTWSFTFLPRPLPEGQDSAWPPGSVLEAPGRVPTLGAVGAVETVAPCCGREDLKQAVWKKRTSSTDCTSLLSAGALRMPGICLTTPPVVGHGHELPAGASSGFRCPGHAEGGRPQKERLSLAWMETRPLGQRTEILNGPTQAAFALGRRSPPWVLRLDGQEWSLFEAGALKDATD